MFLNRFTSLENLFDILKNKRLRLSDPDYWEDKNDASYIEAYRKKKNLTKVFALCFTDEIETIYHWKAFADPNNICCIEFNGNKIIESIKKNENFHCRKVNYIKINELNKKIKNVDDIPFSKRYPYRNENEYRIIFDYNGGIRRKALYINIDETVINKITINQNISKYIFKIIKNEIETLYKINVNRSTIIKNDKWIKYIKSLEGFQNFEKMDI